MFSSPWKSSHRLKRLSINCLVMIVFVAKPALGANHPSIKTIDQYLHKKNKLNPQTTSLIKLGDSIEKHPIYAFVVHPQTPHNTLNILINATMHGDETITTKVALNLINKLLVTPPKSSQIRQLKKRVRLIVQPLVNPDGYRRGMRRNAKNLDINRDFHLAKQGQSQSFTTPEAKAVYEAMLLYKLHGTISLHSGDRAILWPYADSKQQSPAHEEFKHLSKAIAQKMGIHKIMPSYFDYPSHGEYIDFAYRRFNILALTFELSHAKSPSAFRVKAIIKKSIQGILAYIDTLLKQSNI